MKLLMIGGSVFLGRHLVEAALASGHEVTLYNRGVHNPELFSNVERLKGDRNEPLKLPKGRTWDAVIDTCCYFPRQVRLSINLLADVVAHYTLISTISVYGDTKHLNIDENTPVATIENEQCEEVTGETYGALKALCEKEAESGMAGRVLNVRPGLIVGPHDPSDRFTYWPGRIARGGDILAPGPPEREIQFIDVRDLADWTLRMIETEHTGTYNATGPEHPLTMLGFLEACRRTIETNANLVWVEPSFLEESGVAPYTEMPLWIPGEHDTVDCRHAIENGLTFRLLEDTIRATLGWDIERSAQTCDAERRAGLTAEKESELLRAYASTL